MKAKRKQAVQIIPHNAVDSIHLKGEKATEKLGRCLVIKYEGLFVADFTVPSLKPLSPLRQTEANHGFHVWKTNDQG